ncbi:MAG: protein kinase, partial [Chloroflexota bacterium]|nr:protein kinase [Chloroflexota bacterium]
VYLAYDEQRKRRVALKVVSGSHTDYIERFRREAEAIASLNHDHILPAFDYGEQEPWHYLVMPYIEYGTLRDLLLSGSLSLHHTDDLFQQIASALQFAHDQGIIHRDIKPSNILLDNENYTYLADFGLAKSLEGGNTLTQTGALLGTPEYMAPELSEGPATTSSDVYALGILLYQMVTGQVPFSGETPIAVYWKQLRDRPVPPSQINPDVPRAVEQVVLKALHKNPLRRYQSPEELAQAYHIALIAPELISIEEDEPEPPSMFETTPIEHIAPSSSLSYHYPSRQEGQLVLPDNPAAAPAGVAPRRRRFVRRSAPQPGSSRRRFGRAAPSTQPPMEPLTPVSGQHVAQEYSQIPQASQALQTPHPPRRLQRRRSIPQNQLRRRANPVLIASLIGLGLLVLFVVPLIYAYTLSARQASIADATANANATALAKANATQTAQKAQITATANVVATATNAPLILSDDLSSNTNGRWSDDGSTCLFTGGAYHAVVKQFNYLQPCETNVFSFDNTTIQANVSLLSGDNAGLLFRVNGEQFYDFEITSTGQFFFRRHDTSGGYSVLILKTSNSAIVSGGKPNRLLVIAKGDDFKLYINGTFVGEQHDTTYSSGHFGFVVGTLPGTTVAEASFSNLRVYKA